MRGTRQVFRKQQKAAGKWLLALVLTGVMVCTAGCGASKSTEDIAMNGYGGDSAFQAAPEAAAAEIGYETSSAEADIPRKEMKAEGTGQSESAEVKQATADRKLIKTVNMSVETKAFDTMLTSLTDKAAALGGYIESMDTYNGSSYYNYRPDRSASMKVRIPKDNLDTFLETVEGIGNVVNRSESVEDITLTYVDLKSHKEALETEQARLLELLAKAENIEDIVTIEERLSNVRYQIGSMESQLRTFDNQVDYSTVYLEISEVQELTPVEEETVWQRISGGFTDSLRDIGEDGMELVIWTLINIPYLLIWAVVIGLIVFFIRRRIKKARNQNVQKIATGTQDFTGTEESGEKK